MGDRMPSKKFDESAEGSLKDILSSIQTEKREDVGKVRVRRGVNVALAVDLYKQLHVTHGYNAESALKGIALLLLTCDLYEGKRSGWQSFHSAVVYRESNDFFLENNNPSSAL